MTARAGFVLPLVLVGGFLMASLVISFHFVSASDTRSVARLLRGVQAGLLADLASDEIADKVAGITYGPNDTKPPWVKDMLDDLAAARTGAPPFKVRGGGLTFALSDLPLTQAAATRSVATLNIKAVEAKLGPFIPTSTEAPLIYKDALYGDDQKDVRAWDLRGPLSVEVQVAGDRSPFEFSQKFQRGQELVITDTSPPAHEFALFSFLPPPTAEYALSDLQAGGKLIVNPALSNTTSARVHLRGPLFVLAEDAPAPAGKPFLAKPPGDKVQDTSTGKSPSYPDGLWTASLATVPGPRVLLHTDGSTSVVDAALGGIKDAFDGAAEGLLPRRPENDISETKLKTKDKTFVITVTANVTITNPFGADIPVSKDFTVPFGVPDISWIMKEESLALSNNFATDGATFETLDRDVVGYYPPGAYLYAPLAAEKQKFQLFKTAPSAVSRPCYCGVRVPLNAGEPLKWDGANPGGLREGDVITTEPVPRPGRPAGANAGLIGVYGVALFESKTLVHMPIREFTLWMMQKFIDTKVPGALLKRIAMENKERAATQTLAQLGLAETLTFLIRRFRTDAKLQYASAPPQLDGADLRQKLVDKQALLAPYGSWWQENTFWTTQVPGDLLTKCKDALKKPSTTTPPAQALTSLLQQGNQPVFTPDFSTIDPTWRIGDMPDGDTPAKEFRKFLCGEYAQKLIKPVLGGNAGSSGETSYDALLALVKEPKGIAEPTLKAGKRPKGALGDYLGPAPAVADVAGLKDAYPGGYYPTKYRDWDRVITRRYAKMEDLLAAEVKNGALELKGAVMIEKMDFHQAITYRGRGIIVCASDATQTAALDGKVGPVAGDTGSLLTLVHRVGPALLKTGKPPQIKLGDEFTGAVYSDSGVKPSGTTQIIGNLSCGLVAKNAHAAGDTLQVNYLEQRLGCPADKIAERWTVEMTGEVSSTQPGP